MSLEAAIDNFVISGTQLWLSAQQHAPAVKTFCLQRAARQKNIFLKGT